MLRAAKLLGCPVNLLVYMALPHTIYVANYFGIFVQRNKLIYIDLLLLSIINMPVICLSLMKL